MSGEPESSEQQWISILQIIYDRGHFVTTSALSDLEAPDEFEESDEVWIEGILNQMDDAGLVTERPGPYYSLTEVGFRVAHDRKQEKRQRELTEQQNKILNRTKWTYYLILLLTVVLAFGEAINAADTLSWI